MENTSYPANIRLDEDVLKTSFVFVFKRRLDQDEYIRLTYITYTSAEDVFKTSSRSLDQDQYICLGHMSSRRLQNIFKTSCQEVFKTFCKNVFKTFPRHLQDAFKTSCKNIFKTSSRHFLKRLQDFLQRYLQHVFKTYYQVKLFLVTKF